MFRRTLRVLNYKLCSNSDVQALNHKLASLAFIVWPKNSSRNSAVIRNSYDSSKVAFFRTMALRDELMISQYIFQYFAAY